jgi:hypothetical protein
MSVIEQTIKCDWPGCPNVLKTSVRGYTDYGWEGRGTLALNGQQPWHVCREHRFKSNRDLERELLASAYRDLQQSVAAEVKEVIT